jgi:hypothetical protein
MVMRGGTTPKYFAGALRSFFFLIELDLFVLQFQKMYLLDYILLPSSSPATTVVCFSRLFQIMLMSSCPRDLYVGLEFQAQAQRHNLRHPALEVFNQF